MPVITFNLNGAPVDVDADNDEELLWVLRDRIGLIGPKFGCGVGVCGACTSHIDGAAERPCITPVSEVAGRNVVTIEGLAAGGVLHPVQQAWIDEDVAQCGYCQAGQIMSASALLASNPSPSDADIDEAMSQNVCRCGSYYRIRLAIRRAAAGLQGIDVRRIGGADRTETATLVSAATRDSAETVLIARADAYADALTGAPLAVALDAPILLTNSDVLDPRTAAEIMRLGAANAIMLGGEVALSDQVRSDLEELGLDVRRIASADRFGTAAAIAAELPAGNVAYLTEGLSDDAARGWPDAVTVSPLAAYRRAPIFLTTRDSLPPVTAEALEARGVTETIVVGGPSAVSDQVIAQLAAAGHGPRRIMGDNRYATSAALHPEQVAAGMDPTSVWLATGRNWPDALTSAAAVGTLGGTLLLVDGQRLDGSPETRDLLDSMSGVRGVAVLGGTAAISGPVLDAATQLVLG